ncbi:TadE/TadG family type IV pilus assembly protein [Erythrobacter sp. W53]|uniref:TadE/TadG family type IV pilus assembly protein n=1 Tax=Erythrobacter sp. W53 TaxID=3425947 RepID=UPI003D769BFD
MMTLFERQSERASAFAKRLAKDEGGATIMEFGLVSVVFITMMMGMFDIGQMTYTQAVLNGAVQEAARTSTLETGDAAAADARLLELVSRVAPGATISTERKSYFDFPNVERAEPYGDTDGDGLCNNGELYTDENNNGSWDEDVGVQGNGQASDVVIYRVEMEYEPLFPIPFSSEASSTRKLSSVAVKRNQPFAQQVGPGNSTGVCT